jgi:hypothetical protein
LLEIIEMRKRNKTEIKTQTSDFFSKDEGKVEEDSFQRSNL